MKQALKQLLSFAGWRISREPRGIVLGQDLWRDLSLLLEQSPLCFDVGANHGDVSVKLLQLRPSSQIHAFEPGSKCQTELKERFGSESRIKLIASGLGDQVGQNEFKSYANDQLSSFLPLQAHAANPFNTEREISSDRVAITTLDRYCDEQAFNRIDLLKIDTQGYDLRVLQGGEKLFRAGRVDHVLIELNFIPLYQDQPWGHEIMTWLHQHGLQLVDFYEKCRREQRLAWCTALFAKT